MAGSFPARSSGAPAYLTRWGTAVGKVWQFSGKVFWRTGIPYSVGDGNNSALGNGGGTIFATPLGQGWGSSSCSSANAYTGGAVVPCLNANVYLNSGIINNFT